MKKTLITLFAIALAACTGGGGGSSSGSSDIATPGTAVISDYNISSDAITIAWVKTEGADAESWSAYHNDSPTCSAELNASSDNQQSGSCSFALIDGTNSIYVQLCNSGDACSTSDTLEIEHSLAPGAIYLEQLPASTTSTELEVTWVKEQGANGDLWYIFHNGQSACSGSLTLEVDQQPQSASCSIAIDFGEHQFQARLCVDKPADTADICTDSAVHSLTSYFDSGLELATPFIDTLESSLPALATTISWSKDTSSGSAGEDWNLSNNGEVICQGVLASSSTSASCSVQLAVGSNQLQVHLCTDVETYSGASCAHSAIVAVEGFDPNPLEPGTITITNSLPEQVSDEPSLTIDWQITDGNGVSSWSVSVNGSIYCPTTSLDQYHQSGSCPIALEIGTNSISVTGCNYGYDNSESCATSATVSTEYIEPPGTPDITSSLPATTYASDYNLSWERLEGAAADYWLALINDTSQCSDDLVSGTPQSGSCVVELDSGANAISVRLCIANESGSAYCSDSESEQIELLAPLPTQPEIETSEQSITDDTLLIEWSKSSGDNGSYWSLTNNSAAVAACADQPLLSSGSSQSGSCDLPLDIGTNFIVVHLCNDNAAGTASCSTSEGITITRESAAPEFTSASSASVAENTIGVFYTVTVSDADSSADQISLSLSGLDSAHFNLDSASGELSFKQAPNYEIPQDQNQDNTYELNISASDPFATTSLEFSVSVIDSNDEAPQVPSPEASTAHAISEITLDSLIYTVEASDADADDVLTYSLSGVDASHFSLNPSSGELRFSTLPNLEQPQDSNGDNIYDLAVSVSDTAANSTSFELVVTVVDDIGSAPEFDVTSASVEFPENQTDLLVYTAVASDPDGDTITYSLGGVDFNLFSIDASSGAVSFVSTPDYDNPLDSDKDNNYSLSVFARDAIGNQSELALGVLVTAVNSAPSFASATPAPISVPENTSATTIIYTAAASDPDGDPITYSLTGIDSAHFNLGSANGELSFQQAPDFEAPQDQGQDNTYELEIAASDGFASASQTLSVSVSNLNDESPQLTSVQSVALNFSEVSLASVIHTVTATDPDPDDQLTYSLGGADSSHFALDSSSGELSFTTLPTGAQVYDLETIIADAANNSSSFALTISVADDIGSSPEFGSDSASIDFAENSAAIAYTATATDPDGDLITYSLGGADADLFELDATSGALSFKQAPDYEAPLDSDKANDYSLTISAHDPIGNQAQQSLNITITNLNDNPPSFTEPNPEPISIIENTSATTTLYTAAATDLDGDAIVYTLAGLDSAHFNLDSDTAALSFKQSPDFDSPQDQDQDNTYAITINATDADSIHSTSLDLSIEVSNVDEAPQFARASETIEVPEKTTTTIYTAAASDQDGDVITYALAGLDSAHFILSSTTGALNFATSPDFENPQDQDGDNDYHIEIQATSTNHSASLQLSISVTDVEEYAPYFANAASVVNITEDPETEGQQTPILALEFEAYDVEDDAAGHALSLELEGEDGSLFALAATSSANIYHANFITSPDFDFAHDANGDSTYSFTVVVTDSDANEVRHSATIVVDGINDEAPYISAVILDASNSESAVYDGTPFSIPENDASVIVTLVGYDPDRSSWSDPTNPYQPNQDSITFVLTTTIFDSFGDPYVDSDLFYLDPDTLELSPKEPFDYETPLQKQYTENSYDVEVGLTDQAGNSNTTDGSGASHRIVSVHVSDIEDESAQPVESGPQIPWFNSSDLAPDADVGIPWVIYSGEGAINWDMYVNGNTECSYSVSDINSPVSSGTCIVSGSKFTAGTTDNSVAVSVCDINGNCATSESVIFGYAVSSIDDYYPSYPSNSGDASDCAGVEIGEPVNSTNNSSCYNYLLSDDAFGGPYDAIPAYLKSDSGRNFDVIAYFIEWGVYARDFDTHDLPAHLLSTALFSFIKFDGDRVASIDDDDEYRECEDCIFTGEVAIADTWAVFDKPFYKPGEEEKYEDEADDADELAEILADKGVSTGKGMFQQLWLLKQKFPHLKTCVSVGGWSFSRPFPLLRTQQGMLETFVDSIVDLAEEYHFDCIDIDWEFPGKAGGDHVDNNSAIVYDLDNDGNTPFINPTDEDADTFNELIAALRTEILSRNIDIEINSAVYTSTDGMAIMDYSAFANDLHGIHMMTYDYYGAWDPFTGMQAALFANEDPVHDQVILELGFNPYNPDHNIASAMTRGVNNAMNKGFASNARIRQKIVPGLAFYGRNYSGVGENAGGADPSRERFMVPAYKDGNGQTAQFGWEPGNLNYVQIKGYYNDGDTVSGNADYIATADDGTEYSTADVNWTYHWSQEAQTPFLFAETIDVYSGSFISYTDPRAIYYQTCHAAWQNSKGVMFWEISGDSEDFHLVNAIHAAVRGDDLVHANYTNNPSCTDLDQIDHGNIVYGEAAGGGDGDGDGDGGDGGNGDDSGEGLAGLVDLGYIDESTFNSMFPHRNNDPSTTASSADTYTWDGLLTAATNFAGAGFLNEGSTEDRLRELAAFLANTSHETGNSNGGYELSNIGTGIGNTRYDAGYYYQQEQYCAAGGSGYGYDSCNYCATGNVYDYACEWLYDGGTKFDDFYYGRGPLQLSWNYNYGPFSEYYYNGDADVLLYDPNKMLEDSEVAFASAIWFWMSARDGKPAAHDVMIGNYQAEPANGRYPSFGMTINIINGGLECGAAYTDDSGNKNRNRIGFYLTYLNIFSNKQGSGIAPWVTGNDGTTYGSTPATSLDFPTNVSNFIDPDNYPDADALLSCRNMVHY